MYPTSYVCICCYMLVNKLMQLFRKSIKIRCRRKFIEEQTHLTITYDWIIGLVWHLTADQTAVCVCAWVCVAVCVCVCVHDKTYVYAPICRLCTVYDTLSLSLSLALWLHLYIFLSFSPLLCLSVYPSVCLKVINAPQTSGKTQPKMLAARLSV